MTSCRVHCVTSGYLWGRCWRGSIGQHQPLNLSKTDHLGRQLTDHVAGLCDQSLRMSIIERTISELRDKEN